LKRGAGRRDITQQSGKDRIQEEGQLPGHWVKEEREGETTGHEETGGGRKSKRNGSHSESKNENM
jgi:hypothetical protein